MESTNKKKHVYKRQNFLLKSENETLKKIINELKNNIYKKLITTKNIYIDFFLNTKKDDLLSIEEYIIKQNEDIKEDDNYDILKTLYKENTDYNMLLNKWEWVPSNNKRVYTSINEYNASIINLEYNNPVMFVDMLLYILKVRNLINNDIRTTILPCVCILNNNIHTFKKINIHDITTEHCFLRYDKLISSKYKEDSININNIILIFNADTIHGVDYINKCILQGAMFRKISIYPCILECIGYNSMYLDPYMRKGILREINTQPIVSSMFSDNEDEEDEGEGEEKGEEEEDT